MIEESVDAGDLMLQAEAAAPTLKQRSKAEMLRRRRVHYFAGFDPRGAAHYHRLCREEAAKPQPDPGTLVVGAREKLSTHMSRWPVSWSDPQEDATSVETEHVFMGWDDIVRANWSRSPAALAREFVQTYLHLFRHIGAGRVGRMYRPALLAGLLPLLIVALPLLLAALLGGVLGLQGVLSAAVGATAVWWFAARGGMLWLLRIFTFYTRMGKAPIPGHARRTREWTEAIIALQQSDPVDEVLLVGHSVGAVMMVDAVDALLRDTRWQAMQAGRPTMWLTLGQSFPLLALAPGAQAFRDTLARLCAHDSLRWWDVTARIDPLCFHGLAPLAGTAQHPPAMRWPVPHAARFMHMYDAASWRRVRADKLQAHFLYLATPQKRGNFSPLDVMYGPRTLPRQMADRSAADRA